MGDAGIAARFTNVTLMIKRSLAVTKSAATTTKSFNRVRAQDPPDCITFLFKHLTYNGRSKLGVKRCYRNLNFLQRFLHISSALLLPKSFLVVTAFSFFLFFTYLFWINIFVLDLVNFHCLVGSENSQNPVQMFFVRNIPHDTSLFSCTCRLAKSVI